MATIKDQLANFRNRLKRLEKWSRQLTDSEEVGVILELLQSEKKITVTEAKLIRKNLVKSLHEIAEDVMALRDSKANSSALSNFKKEVTSIAKSLDNIAQTLQRNVPLKHMLDEVFEQGRFKKEEPFDPDTEFKPVSKEDLPALLAAEIPEEETERTKLIKQSKLISSTLKQINKIVSDGDLQYYQLLEMNETRARLIQASKMNKQKARFLVASRLYFLLRNLGINRKKALNSLILEIGNIVLSDLAGKFDSGLGFNQFESEEAVAELMNSKSWQSLF